MAGHRVGQAPADPVEDRRAQQQLAHLRRLALQHLRHQVAGDGPLAAGELAHEPLRVRVPGERDRRQAQAGGPSLGPLVKQRHRLVRELDPARPQQLARLLEGEAQVRFSDLGQLAGEAQAVQVQLRLGAARQHDPQARRGAGRGTAPATAAPRATGARAGRRSPARAALQANEGRPAAARPRPRREIPASGRAARRSRRSPPASASITDEPEVLRVSFARLDRDPRRLLGEPVGLEPRAHQHRLAAARGSADENHTVGRGRRQPLEQRLAAHQPALGRRLSLGCERARTGERGVAMPPSGTRTVAVPVAVHRQPVSRAAAVGATVCEHWSGCAEDPRD